MPVDEVRVETEPLAVKQEMAAASRPATAGCGHIGGYVTWAMSHDSLLILTWDENDGSPGKQMATVFVALVCYGFWP